MSSPLAEVGHTLERAGIRYAIIGAHAVNVWLEPRATADIDVTIESNVEAGRKLHDVLAGAGYRVAAEVGASSPSGPDFIRYVSTDAEVTVELQAAKTALQREVLARAQRTESGVLVATPEDLIVLKLIAWRRKDEIDLLGRSSRRTPGPRDHVEPCIAFGLQPEFGTSLVFCPASRRSSEERGEARA